MTIILAPYAPWAGAAAIAPDQRTRTPATSRTVVPTAIVMDDRARVPADHQQNKRDQGQGQQPASEQDNGSAFAAALISGTLADDAPAPLRSQPADQVIGRLRDRSV